MSTQNTIDNRNIEFWNELCGSALARSLGIDEVSPENIKRFDQAYFEYYPYLSEYVLQEDIKHKRVLEIGLGYGTLGSFIAQQESKYFGLDLAWAPAKMMQYRLENIKAEISSGSGQGSALALPFANNYFDFVYTIGCLHHTGNLNLAVKEVYRVLKPGGKAIVMLYNRNSFRQTIQVSWIRLRDRLIFKKSREDFEIWQRSTYDASSAGEAAPFTEYLSKGEVQLLFSAFSHMKVDVQNFDDYSIIGERINLHRKWFLNNVARVLGLDLYIKAIK